MYNRQLMRNALKGDVLSFCGRNMPFAALSVWDDRMR